MKKAIFLTVFAVILSAWNLQGTVKPININPTTSINNLIWAYQNGEWKTNFKTDKFPILSKIEGGEGFWSYFSDNIVNDSYNDTYKWKEGWNLVSPVFENWNLEEKFKDNSPAIWTYKNGKWYLYSKFYSYQNTFDTLNKGEGAWVYLPSIDVKINNTPLFCKNGKCSKITTTNTNYEFFIKTKTFNADLKFGFDLYRYSNDTHYYFAIDSFQIDRNGVTTRNLYICVQKGLDASCKDIDNNVNKIIDYKNGYLIIYAQNIANVFKKSIPSTAEKFSLSLYLQGFNNINNFINTNKFDVYDEIILSNPKYINIEVEIK